jgi:xanthine dehydrogenase YagS FAD-binding subunit
MKNFTLVNPKTIDEAVAALKSDEAHVRAGGTDLFGTMKDEILITYPKTVVNLKTIPGLSYIKEDGGMLKIGAMTVLEDIATNTTVQTKYTALAQAAERTASPHLREAGTIGGNICQMNRCWFFRQVDNRFSCIRKGGNMCYAMAGDNRYHSIFGGIKACFAVNPSDTAPALVALNAKIVTTKRTIDAENFWDMVIPGSTVLAVDEVVTEIQVPTPAIGAKSAFLKMALRRSIDFPIVNCAAMISATDARICLNAVYNKPMRAVDAETAIKGKAIDDTSADAAGAAAVTKAVALPSMGTSPGTKWKINIARTLVKRTILLCK